MGFHIEVCRIYQPNLVYASNASASSVVFKVNKVGVETSVEPELAFLSLS